MSAGAAGGRRRVRLLAHAAIGAIALAGSVVANPRDAAAQQEPPDPITPILAPTVGPACQTAVGLYSLAVFAAATASVPLPLELDSAIQEVRAACQQFVDAGGGRTICDGDLTFYELLNTFLAASVLPIPVVLPPPVGGLVDQVRAIEDASGAGHPLSGPLGEALGCTAPGDAPVAPPAPPTDEPTPAAPTTQPTIPTPVAATATPAPAGHDPLGALAPEVVPDAPEPASPRTAAPEPASPTPHLSAAPASVIPDSGSARLLGLPITVVCLGRLAWVIARRRKRHAHGGSA